MLLRPKQKPYDVWGWQDTQRKEVSRSKTGTARFAELSRLSAKMVDLSLQQPQRDLTLRGAVPNNVAPASWPFLGTSIDAQRVSHPIVENAGIAGTVAGKEAINRTAHLNPLPARGTPREWRRSNFAVLYSRTTVMIRGSGSAAIGNLRRCWQLIQNDHRFSIFRARILSRLTPLAQHTGHIRQRTALLIGHWSRRRAGTFQFLTNRISARVKILTHSEPLQRLKHACPKLRMLTARVSAVGAVIKNKFASAKGYRCPDCGRKVGFRSRPHNLMERYILPLVLTQPVRCAECFRRDYRLIFTPVRECSPHHDESANHIHRNPA
jgi:hypothetical protein